MKQRKVLTVLLALCMVLSLVPVAVFAAPAAASDTADFTVKGGTAAIELLNQYKTGSAVSSWDNSSKTLTLRGIDFTTIAQTAVKLPVGTTIVLADGSKNTIQSGDVTINVSGGSKKDQYFTALDAAGSLTIQGGTEGTGTLEVTAGQIKNEGNAWTYSSGISVYGDLTVKGGHVTARGGHIEGKDSVFSIGVNLDNDIKNKGLLITGGSLTAIAGESYEIQEDGTKRPVFSRGVYMYRGNVTVSGDGRLQAESVKEMADATLLSSGVYVYVGDMIVANSAQVTASGGYGVDISAGSLRLEGGKLTAASTQAPDAYGNLGSAVYVDTDSKADKSGNITVSGGTLETQNGQIYMSTFGAKEDQGLFTVTGGTIVNNGLLYGPKKLDISGGTVQTQSIEADALTISGGTVTVREPVRKSPYNGQLLARPAIETGELTVSGGILDAAWTWGEFTPIVFPVDEYYGYATSLVQMPRDFYTATFTGGTTTLDTGKAGNTALLIGGTLTLGEGMAETGADDSHRQLGTAPVKFAEAAAAKAITSAAVENVKLNYQPGDAPQAMATAAAGQAQYDVRYERWEKQEKDADDTLSAVGYWYSDDSFYSDGDSRFDTFEQGGRYQYSVRLQAKDGYVFDSSLSNDNVTLNGQALPFGSWVNVLDDGKTCFITYGTSTRPGQVVESIRLDAITSFESGDAPRFSTGIVDPIVDTDHQRWDANDGSGYGITSSDYWNGRYNGKLITEFEADTSYTYGVYFKISDLGMEDGYRFDKNTKLYINGTEIALTPEQISVDDNGETIWFSNVLTMTPAPAKTWQKIDVIEIDGATIRFKDGDKPVFTGKTPENAPYIYQFECWETKDGAGVNSAEFFDNAYEEHITAFEGGETYQYILYLKAKDGYYFTADTKIKINGTLYSYRLVNVDPDYDSSGRMYTFWAYTDLTMTPQASGTTPDYKITEGANGTWTQSSGGTLRFAANGDLSKFTGVKVDGKLLTADQYTAVSGSTVVTLKAAYLATLSAGKHTLTVVYTDGDCSTEFEIQSAGGTDPGNNDNPGGNTDPGNNNKPGDNTDPGNNNKPGDNTDPGSSTDSPETGDDSSIILWISLLLVGGGVLAGVPVVLRKKREHR